MGSIVVGVDGSEHSRHALLWAMGEATTHSASLLIVSCWEFPTLVATEVVWTVPPDVVAMAERLVAEVDLGSTGIPYTIVAPEGRPGADLVRIAKLADLLVVGSRGSGASNELLLGSVANYCAHYSRCPVVIVHPPDPFD
jgi:nucleotide-binding universal stress UspA family protein